MILFFLSLCCLFLCIIENNEQCCLFCFKLILFHMLSFLPNCFILCCFVCFLHSWRQGGIFSFFCFNLVFVHCAQTFSRWCIWQYLVASFLVALESRTNNFFLASNLFCFTIHRAFHNMMYYHFFDRAKGFFFLHYT